MPDFDMPDKEADFVTILSSDMIAQIVEEYFNKKVYRQRVEVVDTRPNEAGYMFSLAFVAAANTKNNTAAREPLPEYQYKSVSEILASKRNKKGQFVKAITQVFNSGELGAS